MPKIKCKLGFHTPSELTDYQCCCSEISRGRNLLLPKVWDRISIYLHFAGDLEEQVSKGEKSLQFLPHHSPISVLLPTKLTDQRLRRISLYAKLRSNKRCQRYRGRDFKTLSSQYRLISIFRRSDTSKRDSCEIAHNCFAPFLP